MWDASINAANLVYGISWIGLIVGAILTAVSTLGAFWASGIRDKHSDQQIAQAHAIGEQAKAQAADANARAAEANQKAEEEKLARVKIEQRLAPRALSDDQAAAIAKKLIQYSGQQYRVTTFWDLPEPLSIANRIHHALQLAHWEYLKPEQGGSFLLGGLAGVHVYVHPQAKRETKDAADALISALNSEDMSAQLKVQNAPNNPNDIIAINVGTKP